MKKWFLTSVVFALSLVFATSAFASHYDLQDIDLVNEEIQAKLKDDGILGTEALFASLLTKEGRDTFAKRFDWSAEEVNILAQRLELMQISGIGPKASTLLILSEITSAKVLAKQDVNKLLELLISTNRKHEITGVQPDEDVVRDWILRAKSVIHFLQD